MFRKILVPLDGSPLSQAALPYALHLARPFDGELVLLRVVAPVTLPTLEYSTTSAELLYALRDEQKKHADFYLAELSSQPDVGALRHRALIREGEVAETILEVAQELGADTIVMATHGRSGIARWVLGSVADRLVRSAPVPVLLVRPDMRPDTEVAPLEGSALPA